VKLRCLFSLLSFLIMSSKNTKSSPVATEETSEYLESKTPAETLPSNSSQVACAFGRNRDTTMDSLDSRDYSIARSSISRFMNVARPGSKKRSLDDDEEADIPGQQTSLEGLSCLGTFNNSFQTVEMNDISELTLPMKPKRSRFLTTHEMTHSNQDLYNIALCERSPENGLTLTSNTTDLVTPKLRRRTSNSDVLWLLPGRGCPLLPCLDD